ncbi:hypothetical protein FGO68_gene1631 [Halteria grandinella]|uniref:Uncharacterized protein n=1 Tax=Halteria grandinella TaxID=5974 RepID=A0A8J8NSC2_HALGN|nr:hypothetical protein FGO68_gene1631 [Halteria grandinella]
MLQSNHALRNSKRPNFIRNSSNAPLTITIHTKSKLVSFFGFGCCESRDTHEILFEPVKEQPPSMVWKTRRR